MVKIVRRIKTELFYFKRLVEEGYGPFYWWAYFKNRFFGNYLFTRLPVCNYVADPDFEMHTTCSRHGQGLWMLAWMMQSFLYHSGLKPIVVIHDDNTIDKATADLIISKFPNTKILSHLKTADLISAMPDIPDIVKKARNNCHFFMDSTIDIIALSKAKRIISTDSDILYYKRPTELIDFVEGRTDNDALIMRQISDIVTFDLMVDDDYLNKYKLKEKNIVLMNGGYFTVNMAKININQLAEFLEHTKRPVEDGFIQMGASACLLGQLNYKFFDPQRYAINGFLNDKMVLKHYTSPRRYEMFAYGIDKARNQIKIKSR